MRTFLFLFLGVNAYLLSAQSLPVIPSPQKVSFQEGQFPLGEPLQLIVPDRLELHPTSADVLAAIFPPSAPSAQLKLVIGTFETATYLAQYFEKKSMPTDQLDQEGYHLIIRPDSILLGARTQQGLFYGLQSLRQLHRANEIQGTLPALTITDYPAFRYRAVMDDISRGPISNLDFLKSQIRRLASLKINLFSFYIEHVAKTKKHPDFAPTDAITMEEFKELSDYARTYHIELMGSFQSLGHFRNILKSPTYRPLGASERMLKPGDPASLAFLTDVYDEMLPAFSSDFFNINADEAWDLVRGSMKTVADNIGPGQLYAQHVVPLTEHLLARQKRPMIWGDMLLAHPEAFDYLPKATTLLTWEYGALTDFSDWIDPIKERGFDFWVCPGIVNSNRIMPDMGTAFTNLQNFIQAGQEKGAEGVMTTIWDDGGGHLFSKDWYPVAYAAGQSWHPQRQSADQFAVDFSKVLYQDEKQHLPRAIHYLDQLKALPSLHQLNNALFNEALLPAVGEKHFLDNKDINQIEALVQQADQQLTAWETRPIKATPNEWLVDISSWRFFVDHLQLLTRTYREVLAVAAVYQAKWTAKARPYPMLRQNYATVKDLRQAWQALKNRYIELWFQENRAYSLWEATQVFDAKIHDLTGLETLMEQAMRWPAAKPLPAPALLCLDIHPNTQQYFRFWLLSDPFPLGGDSDFEDDFIGSLGGELKAQPTPYDWLKYPSPFSDKIDFQSALNVDEASVVYTYARIESPMDQDLDFQIGFQEQLTVILNGKRFALGPADRNSAGILSRKLPLKAGKNHLILKFHCLGQKDQFSFLLPDVSVRNRKQKYELMAH